MTILDSIDSFYIHIGLVMDFKRILAKQALSQGLAYASSAFEMFRTRFFLISVAARFSRGFVKDQNTFVIETSRESWLDTTKSLRELMADKFDLYDLAQSLNKLDSEDKSRGKDRGKGKRKGKGRGKKKQSNEEAVADREKDAPPSTLAGVEEQAARAKWRDVNPEAAKTLVRFIYQAARFTGRLPLNSSHDTQRQPPASSSSDHRPASPTVADAFANAPNRGPSTHPITPDSHMPTLDAPAPGPLATDSNQNDATTQPRTTLNLEAELDRFLALCICRPKDLKPLKDKLFNRLNLDMDRTEEVGEVGEAGQEKDDGEDEEEYEEDDEDEVGDDHGDKNEEKDEDMNEDGDQDGNGDEDEDGGGNKDENEDETGNKDENEDGGGNNDDNEDGADNKDENKDGGGNNDDNEDGADNKDENKDGGGNNDDNEDGDADQHEDSGADKDGDEGKHMDEDEGDDSYPDGNEGQGGQGTGEGVLGFSGTREVLRLSDAGANGGIRGNGDGQGVGSTSDGGMIGEGVRIWGTETNVDGAAQDQRTRRAEISAGPHSE